MEGECKLYDFNSFLHLRCLIVDNYC